MKFGVLATPPNRGIYKGLKCRYQMYNTGEIVSYESRGEAETQAHACNNDRDTFHTGWHYQACEIEEEILLEYQKRQDITNLFN